MAHSQPLAKPLPQPLIDAWVVMQLEEAMVEGGSPDREQARSALQAASAANAGRVDEARALLAGLREANDWRVLFLGFQFHFRVGDLDEAEAWVRRRLEILEAAAKRTGAGEDAHIARACTNIGLVLLTKGQPAEARPWLERAVAIDERTGHQEGLARDLGNLANLYEAQGRLEEAESLNRRALAIAEGIGAEEIAAGKLANLGDIARTKGDVPAAIDLWRRALILFERAGVRKWHAELEGKIAGTQEPR